ncbi:MAG: SusF/SusE family outer membrane protein [Tannerella sp.]|jgi:hypothetical protein|nr:SusF/SusE family outer membrane protein [Tannerella sp.]
MNTTDNKLILAAKVLTLVLSMGVVLIVAILITSCEDDRGSNPVMHPPTEFTLNTPPYAAGAIYDLEASRSVELTCSQPDYGFTAAVNYSVQVSLGGDFATEGKFMDLATSYNTARMEVDASEIAVAQTTLALAEGMTEDDFPITTKMYVRLRAALTNGEGEIYSNPVALENVRTIFALSPTVLPTEMYIIGSGGLGAWDWTGAFEMTPVYGENGIFWRIIYCAAGEEMKFNTAKAWDGGEFGTSATVVDNAGAGLGGDGNISVSKAGWYLVTVDADIVGRDVKYTVSFEPPTVYLIGGVGYEGDWSIRDENRFEVPTAADGYFVSPPFGATAEVRMCVSIAGEDWWHSEFIVAADGVINYRGRGDDQERYTQSAGKRAYLNFMSGKGEYK